MEYEALIRLGVFLALFAVFAGVEAIYPRRPAVQTRPRRWGVNLAISVIDVLALRAVSFAVPLLAVGAAMDAARNGWGLFHSLNLPVALSIFLTVLIMDFVIWGQHLLSHKIPLFWRFHRVHHSDRDLDVTTALRFHPIEILLSMGVKIGLVYLIGAPALGVLAFEVILNGTAMFNHANFSLPAKIEPWVRRILVTPDMHRVHHSIHRAEHDSNYGFALSLWDRLFGTYTPEPQDGHDAMTIGLNWQDARPAQLGWVLKLPFHRQ